MKSPSRALRTSTLTTVAAAALLALTGPAALAADHDAEVEVTYGCTSIDVDSTQSISNVVLEFADGDTQRFEGLPESRTGTFAGTGDDSGEVITTAWIKSGNNKSGDGPGYGERFDFDTATCEDDQSNDGNDGTDGTSDDDVQSDDSTAGDGDVAGDDVAGDDGTDEGDDDVAGDDGDDSGTNGTNGTNGTDSTDSTDSTTDGDDVQSDDEQTPEAQVLNAALERDDETATTVDDDQRTAEARVLSAGLERDDDSALRAADATDVRSAEQLPNTGADTPAGLAAALAALALGGGLLRRTSRSSA